MLQPEQAKEVGLIDDVVPKEGLMVRCSLCQPSLLLLLPDVAGACCHCCRHELQ
jgi:hypothetical protein